MARVEITVAEVSAHDLTAGKTTDNATTMGNGAGNGVTFTNDGSVFILVYGGAAGANLTILTPRQVEGLDVAEDIIALVASKYYIFGPFPTRTYNQSDGKVYVDASAADITIRAFKAA